MMIDDFITSKERLNIRNPSIQKIIESLLSHFALFVIVLAFLIILSY